MSNPDRWEPDAHMVASVLAMPKGYVKMTDLPLVDRCWLTAGLSVYGLTVNQIFDRMRCSERLVKSIRAEDMTRMATYAHEQVKALEDQLYAERSAHSNTRRELELAKREAARKSIQLDHFVDAHIVGGKVPTCRRGHPMVGYNVRATRRQKFCRECDRLRKQAERDKIRTAAA